RVVMGAIVVLVLVRQRSRRFRHRAARPPAADRAGDSADQRADRTCRRADSGADQHARDAAGRFSQFVAEARMLVVRHSVVPPRSCQHAVHERRKNETAYARARPRALLAPAASLDDTALSLPIPIMAARLRVGTQGWNYDAWVGPFYPEKTRAADYLSIYARAFDTVEVDSTFYAIPASKTVRGWAQRTPDDFIFSLKLPQEITHERRLRNVDDLAAEFFDRARELGHKLGPILIQLGPDFGPTELPAVAQFLPKLPRDIRFAIEFRQRGWIHDGLLAL